MTSSFQNVVGTPRDAIPDISATNYAQAGADLTKSQNNVINDNINKTKEHFKQMVEIEELAAKAFDTRLNALVSIAGAGSKIATSLIKAGQAREADGISRQAQNDFVQQGGELVKEIQNVAEENEYQFGESDAVGTIKGDKQISVKEQLDLRNGIIPDEDQFRNDDNFIKFYSQESTLANNTELLYKQNAFKATSTDEFESYVNRNNLSYYRSAIYAQMERTGSKTVSKRFLKQLFREVQPKLNQNNEINRRQFLYDLKETVENNESYVTEQRVYTAVMGAFVRDKESGKRLNDTFFGPKGIVAQIQNQYNLPNRGMALDRTFEIIGTLVEKGTLPPEAAKEIYSNLQYSPDNEKGKTYDSYQAYVVAQKNQTTPFAANANARILKLSKVIQDVESKKIEFDLETRKQQANDFIIDKVIPAMYENRDRIGIAKLEESQVGAFYTEFIGSDWYLEGITPIPEILKTAQKETHTGGARDPQVVTTDKYKDHFDNVEKFVKNHVKEVDAASDSLNNDDLRLVEHIMSAYKKDFYGERGQAIEILEAALAADGGKGEYTLSSRRDELLGTKDGSGNITTGLLSENSIKGFQTTIAEGPIKLADSGAQQYLDLKAKLQEDPSYFNTKQAFKGEPVDRLFEFLDSGGTKNREIIAFYKNLNITKINAKGEVEVLSGTAAIYERGEILGMIDPKTKLVNPYAEIFQTIEDKNAFSKHPSDAQALRHLRTDEEQQWAKVLKIWSEKSGPNTDVDSYKFDGAGRTKLSTPLSEMSLQEAINLAKSGKISQIGMYNFTADAMTYFENNAETLGLDLNSKMTEDLQSYLVIQRMREKTNRTNAIRGAVTKDTKDYRRMINLNTEELKIINAVFPNLQNNYFASFENLQEDVAKILVSDLERLQKSVESQRQRARQKRNEEELERQKVKRNR